MIKKKNYNGLLVLGISAIVFGLALLFYSITSYSEIKMVTDKIDFDTLDYNNQIPTNEKYYKYSAIWDTLNQKLEKNKNFPVKNMSCAYLDYAQHNTKSMYNLVYKNSNEDIARQIAVKKNINTLIDMYKNYGTCRKTVQYTDELIKILAEIENYENGYNKDKINNFININKNIEDNNLKDDVFYQYEHQIIHVNTDENIIQNTPKVLNDNTQENQYQKVQKYIESDGDKDTGSVYYATPQTLDHNTQNTKP